MPLPSDVFPALFDALRDRLAVHVSAVDSVTPGDNTPVAWTPLISSSPAASDTLLTSLSTSDPRLHRCIVQEIRHNASASRLEMLRRRRLEVRRTREAKRKHKQRLDAVAAAERDTALLDISTHDHKFQLFVTETHAKATARLQVEWCLARKIKKALVRMEGVAADTTEESESMCAVAFTQLGSARQFKAAQNFKSHGMLEILGPSCMWRSCITSQDTQNNTNLCMWHASVQRFIEVGESMQYTPNGSRMKEAMITVGTDSLVERTKRVIQTSSSLLE
ncbi:hypothetical protein JG687_00010120, partial [Phytophthora cactorum]